MRLASKIVLLGWIITAAPAQAEFQLSPVDAFAAPVAQVRPEHFIKTLDRSLMRRRTAKVPVAHGYGRRVPLDFAVRQIVPRKVAVSYGSGVDPQAIVDWTGGRPWTATLRSAVRPLGLRVTVQNAMVTITHG